MVRDSYKTYFLEEKLNKIVYINGILQPFNNQGQVSEDENIDFQIIKDLKDDIDVPENETEEIRIFRVKRYKKLVKELKKKYDYRCQVSGCGYSFKMDNGNYYCEAHHIRMLSKDGTQSHENVIILCANHHRMFHYAKNLIEIGDLINSKRTIKIENNEFTIIHNMQ